MQNRHLTVLALVNLAIITLSLRVLNPGWAVILVHVLAP
jgi:hypothetical protein